MYYSFSSSYINNFFFVTDEYTDVEDERGVEGIATIIVDAMTNPQKPRPEGENILGEIARQ